jgi:CBS domain-containing protein
MPAQPTVDVAERLDLAVQLMSSYDVSHLIVVDRGYPVGIVSVLDVAAAAAAGA